MENVWTVPPPPLSAWLCLTRVSVCTYYVYMGITNITLSVNEETLRNARRRADSMGKSVNQLVREYLEQLAGKANRNTLADELDAAWRHPQGNSRGWKFNREELHERR